MSKRLTAPSRRAGRAGARRGVAWRSVGPVRHGQPAPALPAGLMTTMTRRRSTFHDRRGTKPESGRGGVKQQTRTVIPGRKKERDGWTRKGRRLSRQYAASAGAARECANALVRLLSLRWTCSPSGKTTRQHALRLRSAAARQFSPNPLLSPASERVLRCVSVEVSDFEIQFTACCPRQTGVRACARPTQRHHVKSRRRHHDALRRHRLAAE